MVSVSLDTDNTVTLGSLGTGLQGQVPGLEGRLGVLPVQGRGLLHLPAVATVADDHLSDTDLLAAGDVDLLAVARGDEAVLSEVVRLTAVLLDPVTGGGGGTGREGRALVRVLLRPQGVELVVPLLGPVLTPLGECAATLDVGRLAGLSSVYLLGLVEFELAVSLLGEA